jgi:hypothetical protein
VYISSSTVLSRILVCRLLSQQQKIKINALFEGSEADPERNIVKVKR